MKRTRKVLKNHDDEKEDDTSSGSSSSNSSSSESNHSNSSDEDERSNTRRAKKNKGDATQGIKPLNARQSTNNASGKNRNTNGKDIGMKRIQEHFIAMSKRKTKTAKGGGGGLFSALNPPLQVKDSNLNTHALEKEELLSIHIGRFERWWWELEQGFSILLQGYGSKSLLLDLFASCVPRLSAHGLGSERRYVEPLVCTVRGWSSQVDIKRLVDRLMRQWLEWDTTKIATEKRRSGGEWTLADRCSALVRHAENSRRCLVLVMHSLDGEAVRSDHDQQALSCLAASPSVRFIASVDHLNSALLWSRRDTKRFNFLCHDATSFVPYTLETRSFSHPAVSSQSIASVNSARGVAYVLQSLTPTHIKILTELARRQLQSTGVEDEQIESEGLDFQSLLQHCLDMMWVSNAATLKQYLKEFQDHSLIRMRMANGRQIVSIDAPAHIIRRDILKEPRPAEA